MLILSERFFRWRRQRTFTLFSRFDSRLRFGTAVLEAMGFVARLNDVAVVRQPIQQRRGEFGIAEHTAPFREG